MRDSFAKNTDPMLLIDFAGIRVFDSATVDVNILLLAKTRNRNSTKYVVTKHKDVAAVRRNLRAFVEHHYSIYQFGSSDSWIVLSPTEQSIRQKVEKTGTPLKDWNIKINFGIVTSCNKAFRVYTSKRNEILSNCMDDDERQRTEQLIRPLLCGSDIKRNGYDWKNLWLINTHNGVKGRLPRIRIEDYPAVKAHLDQYFCELSLRGARGATPYNIRSCNYLEDFTKPKIMYSDIAQTPKFYYDAKGEFLPDATTFILRGEHLQYLVDFLNSDVSAYIFKTFYAGGGLGEHGVRYKKAFLEKMPVPKPRNDAQKFDNALIYSLYGFSDDEIKYIERKIAES